MNLPPSSRYQFTQNLNICRILNGMWQVSGAHGIIDPQRAISEMFDYVAAGFTTWDLADHYGPAEDFIGEFRKQLADKRGKEALNQIQAFTKWVPRPATMTRQIVDRNIDISLKRMGVESLDLMQFHWWEYRDKNYLDALHHMANLQQEGKIKHLALTNFDTEHLKIITEAGIKIVSNQVQFSLIDRRPLDKMIPFCQENNIQILAYGTLCGGLLSEKYLGHSEPSRWNLQTASLGKYKNMINIWGGWQLFQKLLETLKIIAHRHNVTMPNIALRYILEQPTVAGAIVGARLGIAQHRQENARVFDFQLDTKDYQALESIFTQSRNLLSAIGDCGDEYRR